MKKIAIIGMGVSGVAVLKAFNDLKVTDIEIDCFDKEASFGKGFPFIDDTHCALNNSRTHEISYDYKNSQDFEDWLQAKKIKVEEYMPRHIYGDYQKDRLQALIKNLPVKVHLQQIQSLDYDPQTHQFSLIADNDQNYGHYDEVHLCCGQLPPNDPYQLGDTPRYIASPYPFIELPEDLKNPENKLVIVGTGLASIDILKYLWTHNPQAKLQTFSRDNFFSSVRGQDEEEQAYQFLISAQLQVSVDNHQGYLTFSEFERLFEKECQNLGISWSCFLENHLKPGFEGLAHSIAHPQLFGRVQALCLHVTEIMYDFWYLMPMDDRDKFLDTYGKAIVLLRNPMPDDSAEMILQAHQAGDLELLDHVDDIHAKSQAGFDLIYQDQSKGHADWIINATGYDLKKANQDQASHLIRDLLNKRLVEISDLGGLNFHYEDGGVISPRFGLISGLKAHGTLIDGEIYQNNSTFQIQKHAERIINRIYS